MSVAFKDYYEVLGVARNSSDAAIKKAFRKLARTHHPDVAKDKKSAEEKFKEINEANEVLSDPLKRKKYDELGASWDQPERQTQPPQSGYGRNPQESSEFHFDGTGFSDFFEQYFGGRGQQSGGFSRETGNNHAQHAQHGQDIESDILVTLDEVLHGSSRTIQLQRTDPHTGQSTTQTLRVKIPPGVKEAQMIRLAGKGNEGTGGGNAGNLYLKVKFGKHPDFRVSGTNLFYDLELTPWEAVLGATISIATLDGKISLKIPPNTSAEREFRLRGKGLPIDKNTRGDLHAIVSIQVPASSTAEEKELWGKLAVASTFNPRKNL